MSLCVILAQQLRDRGDNSLTESANFSQHNDSLRLRWAETWTGSWKRRGGDGTSRNIHNEATISRVMCVCVHRCVLLTLWVLLGTHNPTMEVILF